MKNRVAKLFGSYCLWTILSLVFLLFFIIVFIYMPCVYNPEHGVEKFISLLLILLLMTTGPFITHTILVTILVLTITTCSAVNLCLSTIPKQKFLTISKIFTITKLLGMMMILAWAFRHSIQVSVYFIVSAAILILISLIQLLLLYQLKPQDTVSKGKIARTAQVILIITCSVTCFHWGFFFPQYLPYIVFIILIANTIVALFFSNNSVLNKSVALLQVMAFFGALLYFIVSQDWHWRHDIKTPSMEMSIALVALALIYLLLVFFTKKVTLPKQIFAFGYCLLGVILGAIFIKDTNQGIEGSEHLLARSLCFSMHALIYVLCALIIGIKRKIIRISLIIILIPASIVYFIQFLGLTLMWDLKIVNNHTWIFTYYAPPASYLINVLALTSGLLIFANKKNDDYVIAKPV